MQICLRTLIVCKYFTIRRRENVSWYKTCVLCHDRFGYLTRRYLSESKNVATVFRELNGRESARSTKQQRDQTWTLMGSAIWKRCVVSGEPALTRHTLFSALKSSPIPAHTHVHTYTYTHVYSRCPVGRVSSLRPIGILKSFSLAQNNFSKKKKNKKKRIE